MTHFLLVTGIMTAVTYFTRAVPFLFFSKREPPPALRYLQRYLPLVVMLVLVFSSYKDIDFHATPYGIPALIAGTVTAILHFWKRNVLISIIGGTALYMILIRVL